MAESNEAVEIIIAFIILLLFIPIFSSLLSTIGIDITVSTEFIVGIVELLLYILIAVVIFSALASLLR